MNKGVFLGWWTRGAPRHFVFFFAIYQGSCHRNTSSVKILTCYFLRLLRQTGKLTVWRRLRNRVPLVPFGYRALKMNSGIVRCGAIVRVTKLTLICLFGRHSLSNHVLIEWDLICFPFRNLCPHNMLVKQLFDRWIIYFGIRLFLATLQKV